AVIDDKAGDEVLIFAGRDAILQANADHLVAGPFRAVPRAMLGGKRIAAIFRREVAAVVESEPQRSRMRLQQHVGDGDLVLQVGALAGMSRVLMVTDVEPGPAVEGAFANPRD